LPRSVWDVRSGAVVRTLESKGAVTSIEVTEGGRFIVTADGASVDFRDGASLDLLKSHAVAGFTPESASYCPERGRFVAGGNDMWVHLFDYESGAELESGRGHHGPVHCIRFAPGGATYASGSEDGTIRIWQTDYTPPAAAAPAGENGHVPVAPPPNGAA
jgi:serine-threonine kinase receptor-associated protein